MTLHPFCEASIVSHKPCPRVAWRDDQAGDYSSPVPPRQGHPPCTLSAKNLSYRTSNVRALLWERPSRGLLAPCTPAAGGFPLHPSCEEENGSFQLLFACWLGNEGKCAYDRKAHGRNENEEKSRSGKFTFLPVFSHFPRMQKHPAGGVSHRPARGRRCRSQFSKFSSSFCKRVSAWCQCPSQFIKEQRAFFQSGFCLRK